MSATPLFCSLPSERSSDEDGSLGVRRGITVAGGCNGSASTNQTVLSWPADVFLAPNDTLYVANYDGKLFAFDKDNRTARTVATFMYLDNRTAEMYVSVQALHLVYILPSNRTIPPNGVTGGVCSATGLNKPYAIITDSVGNVYIVNNGCRQVMKWAPNALFGTVVA